METHWKPCRFQFYVKIRAKEIIRNAKTLRRGQYQSAFNETGFELVNCKEIA